MSAVAGAAALYLAAVLVLTWPQAIHLTTHVGGHVDALFSVWRLAWIADAVRYFPGALFDPPIFWPEQNALAYSDAILGTGLAVAPARWIGLGPIVTYNIAIIVSYVASCLAMFVLVRQLTGRADAAFLSGLIFGLSHHRAEHFERLELLTSFLMPLALAALHRAITERRAVWAATAVALTCAQFFLGIYHGTFFALLIFVLGVCVFFRAGLPWRVMVGAIPAVMVSAVCLYLYAQPYFEARERLGERAASEIETYSATPENFIAVHPRNRAFGAWLSRFGSAERFLFPGLLCIVGVMLAALNARTQFRAAWPYWVALLLAVDLALGSHGLTHEWLREYVTTLRGLRAPARAGIVVLLAGSVLAGFGWAHAFGRLRRTRAAAVTVTLALLSLAEFWTPPMLWQMDEALDEASSRMYGITRQSVLIELPVRSPSQLDTSVDAHYMVDRIGVWPRLLNGYSGHYPHSYIDLLGAMKTFPDSRSLRALRRRGVSHIALHERYYEGDELTRIEAALAATGETQPMGRYRDGSDEVVIHSLIAR